jgi:hypothetical protein
VVILNEPIETMFVQFSSGGSASPWIAVPPEYSSAMAGTLSA